MKKHQKFLAFTLACLMFVLLCAGCGSAPVASESEPAVSSEEPAPSSEAEPEEVATLKYICPGEAAPEHERVQTAINAKLAADNTGLQVDMQFIPWDVWDQKINIMLSTGEEFDIFFVMNDRVSLSNYVAKGGVAEIGEELQEFGPNILANCSDLAFKSGQVGGKTYALPAEWLAPEYNRYITMRQDLADKWNIPTPTNFEELTEAMQIAYDNWEKPEPPYWPVYPVSFFNGATLYFFSSTNDWMLNEKMVYVNQDGTVKNFFETEEFKEVCNNAREWYTRGFIDPDCLTINADAFNQHLYSANWFISTINFGNINSLNDETWPDLSVDDYTWLNFFPDGKAIRPYGTRNLNAVPLSSKHPEGAVKLYNWIYDNQDNYRLFQFGEEGKDYTVDENGNMNYVLTDTGVNTYVFSTWNSANVNLSEKWAPFAKWDSPSCYYDHMDWTAENIEDGYAAALVFDPSNVQTEMGDCLTQIDTYMLPMALGVVDYDSHIDEALKVLETAGIDKVIEEYKTQLAAIK